MLSWGMAGHDPYRALIRELIYLLIKGVLIIEQIKSLI